MQWTLPHSAPGQPEPSSAPRPDDLVDLLVRATGLAAAALALWLLVGLVLALVAETARRAGHRARAGLDTWAGPALAPVLRRAAGVLLGAGLLVPAAAPALAGGPAPGTVAAAGCRTPATGPAQPGPAQPSPAQTAGEPAPLPPGWTPDRPARPPRAPAAASSLGLVTTVPRARQAVPETVAVRRGDSLWAIAQRVLGPGADDEDVAAEWPRWYAANRAAIGPDPALIRPGQLLRPPA